jgi:hypothetical protein
LLLTFWKRFTGTKYTGTRKKGTDFVTLWTGVVLTERCNIRLKAGN